MAKQSDKLTPAIPEEMEPMVQEWCWFLSLGIGLVALGLLAISLAPFVTGMTVLCVGLLLLIGGVLRTVSAFWSPRWSGIFLHLVLGILYLIVGSIILEHPEQAAEGITLLMGAFFIFAGVIGIVWSLQVRFFHWGWALLNGVVTLILGAFILHVLGDDPQRSTIIIGLFVAIEMIFSGWLWIMIGLSLRRIAKQR